MKTKRAILYFGTAAKLARALNISNAAVSRWGEYVPPASAARLEKLTGGELVFEPLAYRRHRGRLWSPKGKPSTPAPSAAEDRAA